MAASGDHDAAGSGRWAAAAMVLGAALALRDVAGARVSRSMEPIRSDAIAEVDGVPILRVDFERALQAVAEGRRSGAVDAALRQHVLDRLIDEQLLVRRALDLGLAEQDPIVRSSLAAAVLSLESVRAEDAPAPDSPTLRAFFEREKRRYATPVRVQLDRVFVRLSPASAVDCVARIRERVRAGANVTEARTAEPCAGTAEAIPAGAHEAPMLLAEIAERWGQEAMRCALQSAPLGDGCTLAAPGGTQWLRVRSRNGGDAPPFEAVETQVTADWRRAEGDQRVRAWLDAARARADVRIRPDARTPDRPR